MSNSSFQRWCPTDIFNTGQAGAVCEVLDAFLASAAGTANQQIVAAVSGKKIIVLGGTLYSVGAAGVLLFKSASGGTIKHAYSVPLGPGTNYELPTPPWGNISTDSGQALVVDNQGAAVIAVSIRYIVA